MASDTLVNSKARWYRRAQARFQKWVNRRIPPAREVTLDQRRIFIFPSKAGLFFIVCLAVMLLTAVNFQNNLTYAVTFLLATLFVVATLHTFANLSDLTLRAVRAAPAFPGQQSEFELMLDRAGQRDRYGLYLKWPHSSEALVNLIDESSIRVRLHMPVGKRGWYKPERLLLESTYPLGLLRAWTWVDLDLHALVYPQPLAAPELVGAEGDSADGSVATVIGSDDFYGIREYQRGDSLRHIHWQGLAKGHGLQSKQYTAYAERSIWLDWNTCVGIGVEQKLSHLCYWALQFEARGDDYGLRLPDITIEPDSGERHREAVLRALALFGISGTRQ